MRQAEAAGLGVEAGEGGSGGLGRGDATVLLVAGVLVTGRRAHEHALTLPFARVQLA